MLECCNQKEEEVLSCKLAFFIYVGEFTGLEYKKITIVQYVQYNPYQEKCVVFC
jgi:hypothetical protein